MLTESEIKSATTTELVEYYNKITGKSIKKFSSRAAGETQVLKLVKESSTANKKAVVKDSGKRAEYESRVIQVLSSQNPKREGSIAHKKFAVLQKMNGKTIGELRSLEGNHPELDKEAGWPSTELRWALKLGLVTINKIQQVKAA
jgi:hypothetical protein